MSSKQHVFDSTRLAIAIPTFRGEPIGFNVDPPLQCLCIEAGALKVAFMLDTWFHDPNVASSAEYGRRLRL
jgi:hypothetical protein